MATQSLWIDRGDPTAWDFAVGNFTTDYTWRDLDLSSIVPAGSTMVRLRYSIAGTAAWLLEFRENGNSSGYNASPCRVHIGSNDNDGMVEVWCDTNRVIEYRATSGSWTKINVVIVGWYIPITVAEATELTENTTPALEDIIYTVDDPSGSPLDRKVTLQNLLELAPHWVDRGDPTDVDFDHDDLTKDNNWYDLDLSSIVPSGATMIKIRLWHAGSVVGESVGFRKNGNSNNYSTSSLKVQVSTKYIDDIYDIFCDTNRVIEYKVSSTNFSEIGIVVLGWYIDTVN